VPENNQGRLAAAASPLRAAQSDPVARPIENIDNFGFVLPKVMSFN
jgi:hypothetical protein